MTLRDDLLRWREQADAARSAQEREERRREAAEISAGFDAATVLAVGDRISAFRLADADGVEVASEHLLRKGPLVIVFYRGGWCPYCNLTLRAWQEHLPQLDEVGAGLVAVTPEMPDRSLSASVQLSIDFPVLTDVDDRVASDFGIVFAVPHRALQRQLALGFDLAAHNAQDDIVTLPVPATFAVETTGVVVFAHVDLDYTRRADPADVIRAVAAGA